MKKDELKGKIKQLPGQLKSLWREPPKGRYLTIKEALCFGGSALGVSFIVNMIAMALTATSIPEIYGIGVMHGPIIVVASSVLGLIIHPLFGKLLQNTNTKWGRYKPYILFVAPIISAFGIAATWLPQNLNEQSMTIFAYVTCIPSLILWNIWYNTFNMMPAVVTPNQQERSDIWAPVGLVIGFAPTVLNFIKGYIRDYFLNQGREYLAFRYMGLISVVLGLLFTLLLIRVKERLIVTSQNNEKVGLFEGLKMVMKNKPLMILTVAMVLGSLREVIGIDFEMLAKLRYATTIGEGLKLNSSLGLIIGFAATPNMILLPLLTRKFNNKTITMGWTALNAIGYGVLAIIGVQNLPQGPVSAGVLTTLRFIALFNAWGSLLPLMLSEIYDAQQLLTGKRLEGFIQTFAYTFVGLCSNIGILALGFVKKSMGYEPKNYFNVETVSDELMNNAIRYFNFALIVSAVSAALMCFVMIFYKLNKKEHARIVEELEKISAAESAATDEAPVSEMDFTHCYETELPSNAVFSEGGACADGGADDEKPTA